jgi:hypothetical protein
MLRCQECHRWTCHVRVIWQVQVWSKIVVLPQTSHEGAKKGTVLLNAKSKSLVSFRTWSFYPWENSRTLYNKAR